MLQPKSSSFPRRKFIQRLGGLFAGAAVSNAIADEPKAAPVTTPPFSSRGALATAIREKATKRAADAPFPVFVSNGDEDRYPDKLGNFTKGLPHNELGEVRAGSYAGLVEAIKSGRHEDFEKVGLGGHLKLVNPQAAFCFALEGNDPHQFACEVPPAFSSAALGAEMTELYWMSLLRDVPFDDYEKHPLTMEASGELTGLKLSSCQTSPEALFRGPCSGDLVGPYLSQFLWLDVPYGAGQIVQKYKVAQPGIDFLTDFDEWLDVQRGYFAKRSLTVAPELRYIRTGRDLAEWDHRDFSFHGFMNAALILLGPAYSQKPQRIPLSPTNPYVESLTQAGFCTFGGPFVLDMLSRASSAALRASWTQKWFVHRLLRPEEFGGRVHAHSSKMTRYPLHEQLLDSKALHLTHKANATFLLPQSYPEGCPLHPSYPSGHAVLAGAGATILKAFFDENFVLPKPVIPASDGRSLLPLKGATLTVGNELNKLAGNIAFGRNFAGIHWRSDALEGLRLGENVAIALLQDMKMTLTETNAGFRFTKFDGSRLEV